jgi:hypothetical protein
MHIVCAIRHHCAWFTYVPYGAINRSIIRRWHAMRTFSNCLFFVVLSSPTGRDPVNNATFSHDKIDPIRGGCSRSGFCIVQRTLHWTGIVNTGKLVKIQARFGGCRSDSRHGLGRDYGFLGVDKGTLVIALQGMPLVGDQFKRRNISLAIGFSDNVPVFRKL